MLLKNELPIFGQNNKNEVMTINFGNWQRKNSPITFNKKKWTGGLWTVKLKNNWCGKVKSCCFYVLINGMGQIMMMARRCLLRRTYVPAVADWRILCFAG